MYSKESADVQINYTDWYSKIYLSIMSKLEIMEVGTHLYT